MRECTSFKVSFSSVDVWFCWLTHSMDWSLSITKINLRNTSMQKLIISNNSTHRTDNSFKVIINISKCAQMIFSTEWTSDCEWKSPWCLHEWHDNYDSNSILFLLILPEWPFRQTRAFVTYMIIFNFLSFLSADTAKQL